MAMTCFKCKAEIETGKKFCAECGSSIELDFVELHNSTKIEGSETVSKKSSAGLAAVLTVLAIFVGIFFGAYSLINSGVQSVTESFSPDASPSIPETSGTLGQQVQDGQMTFQLNNMPKCFESGSNKLCRFDVSVFNHSKTAATFFDSNQKLVDSSGNFYDAASPYMRSDYSADFVMRELNPGLSARGYIFFELPQSVTPTKLILHDSVFSGGVAVSFELITNYGQGAK